MNKRDFKGIWIPKEIWLSEKISAIEKILLSEIDSLDNKNGCTAGNEYFADLLGISKTSVSDHIKKLKKLGYIKQISFNGRIRILKSQIKVIFKADLKKTSRQPSKKAESRVKENFKADLKKTLKPYNNTSNNTINNTSNKEGKIKDFPILSKIVKDFIKYQKHKFGKAINNTETDIKNGIDTLDKLIRIDGFDINEIKTTLHFALKNDFWHDKVLSISGLRKKRKGSTKFQKIYISAGKDMQKKINENKQNKISEEIGI